MTVCGPYTGGRAVQRSQGQQVLDPCASPTQTLRPIIADVEWYGTEAEGHVAAQRSRMALGCPIFKKHHVDDKQGNFWPVDKLAPCSLLAVPHDSGARTSSSDRTSNHVVILNRHASFLSKVPQVQ